MREIKDRIYTDGLLSVQWHGGVVRLRFGVLDDKGAASTRTEEQPAPPALVETCELFISPEGLLRTLGGLQQLAQKLQAEGILKQQPASKQPDAQFAVVSSDKPDKKH